MLLKQNMESVQDVEVRNEPFVKILVKDIGLANLPSLTKLTINEEYELLMDDVIKYLNSGNASKLKGLYLRTFRTSLIES